jgi:hypothetical protein
MQNAIDQDDIEPTTTTNRRPRMPSGYPVLADITIDPADWFRFNNLNADTPATRIIGHDDPHDGLLIVHVASASNEVRDRLQRGWV